MRKFIIVNGVFVLVIVFFSVIIRQSYVMWEFIIVNGDFVLVVVFFSVIRLGVFIFIRIAVPADCPSFVILFLSGSAEFHSRILIPFGWLP